MLAEAYCNTPTCTNLRLLGARYGRNASPLAPSLARPGRGQAERSEAGGEVNALRPASRCQPLHASSPFAFGAFGRMSFLGQKITAEAQRAQKEDSGARVLVLLCAFCVSAVQAFRPHREMHPSPLVNWTFVSCWNIVGLSVGKSDDRGG